MVGTNVLRLNSEGSDHDNDRIRSERFGGLPEACTPGSDVLRTGSLESDLICETTEDCPSGGSGESTSCTDSASPPSGCDQRLEPGIGPCLGEYDGRLELERPRTRSAPGGQDCDEVLLLIVEARL